MAATSFFVIFVVVVVVVVVVVGLFVFDFVFDLEASLVVSFGVVVVVAFFETVAFGATFGFFLETVSLGSVFKGVGPGVAASTGSGAFFFAAGRFRGLAFSAAVSAGLLSRSGSSPTNL